MSEKTLVIFYSSEFEKREDIVGKIGLRNFHKAHEIIIVDKSGRYLEVVKSRSGDTFDRILDSVLETL